MQRPRADLELTESRRKTMTSPITDVYVSAERDTDAVRRSLRLRSVRMGGPSEVVTDRAAPLGVVIDAAAAAALMSVPAAR